MKLASFAPLLRLASEAVAALPLKNDAKYASTALPGGGNLVTSISDRVYMAFGTLDAMVNSGLCLTVAPSPSTLDDLFVSPRMFDDVVDLIDTPMDKEQIKTCNLAVRAIADLAVLELAPLNIERHLGISRITAYAPCCWNPSYQIYFHAGFSTARLSLSTPPAAQRAMSSKNHSDDRNRLLLSPVSCGRSTSAAIDPIDAMRGCQHLKDVGITSIISDADLQLLDDIMTGKVQ